MKVVFVGDRASRLNLDPSIAFVGTPSYINLCKWVAKMQIANFIMINSFTHDDQVALCQQIASGEKIFIALGNNASKELKKLGIDHFKLPHPSPRNRQLNDQEFIDSKLHQCYLYLKERKCVTSATISSRAK